MIALHMGGIPELAMALGPLLLIAVFIKIARNAESDADDEDWDSPEGDHSSRFGNLWTTDQVTEAGHLTALSTDSQT